MKIRYTLAVRFQGTIVVHVDPKTDDMSPDKRAVTVGAAVAQALVESAMEDEYRPNGVLELHVDGRPWICATEDVE